jgi:MarR family transcriptional regulator for hemolysin
MSSPDTREYLGILIGRIARSWRNEVDRRLAVFGITQSRWLTLLHLSRMAHPVTQRELASAMGVQAPTLVPILDRLEAEHLIERRTASADRRSKSVHLSAAAAPVLQRIAATTATIRSELFEGVSEPELAVCVQLFERLAGRLGGAMPPPPGANDGTHRPQPRTRTR